MKRTTEAVSLGFILAVLSWGISVTHAQVIYLDNFEQFPNGTSLLSTNYVPASGPSEASASFAFSGSSPTVTASNFFGSRSAFFNLAGYGDSFYTCSLALPLTNQILTESWTLCNVGGTRQALMEFDVMLPATNGTMRSLVNLWDNGGVLVLSPGSDVDHLSYGGVASYSLETLMTNQLIVNYPANTFSFSINGVMVANKPLCGLFTNLVGQTVFEVAEDTRFPNYTGQFALDNVMIETVPEPASSGMVILGIVMLLVSRQLRRRSP